MEAMIRNTSVHGQKILLCSIFLLLSLLLMGAVSVTMNISENETAKNDERDKISRMLDMISAETPERHRVAFLEKSHSDPYFYFLANTSCLRKSD